MCEVILGIVSFSCRWKGDKKIIEMIFNFHFDDSAISSGCFSRLPALKSVRGARETKSPPCRCKAGRSGKIFRRYYFCRRSVNFLK